ncbi:unnamed protein product [Ambrosiozyma monospora]|uniref:Unnamed protein product n=1 Tax=Ambrosiozyma monospora TaxID=43982 RepID=A0ACB5UCT0_AMBMO|nr:unnamed protein product [Ambrosiozyma monospora]
MGVIFYLINELGCQYDQSIFSDYELEQLNLQNYRTFGSGSGDSGSGAGGKGKRKRALSISIGEFSNNNEKIRKLSSGPGGSAGGVGGDSGGAGSAGGNAGGRGKKKVEDSVKSQILNDQKFFFIVKNLEICFVSWLNLFNSNSNHSNNGSSGSGDAADMDIDRFIEVFTRVLHDEFYSKLTYLVSGSPESTTSYR